MPAFLVSILRWLLFRGMESLGLTVSCNKSGVIRNSECLICLQPYQILSFLCIVCYNWQGHIFDALTKPVSMKI